MSERKSQSSIPPLSISNEAVTALENIRRNKQIPEEYIVRLGTKMNAEAGYSYILGFDQKKENDEEYQVDGLKILVDRRHILRILGLQIDYRTGIEKSGFVFRDPSVR